MVYNENLKVQYEIMENKGVYGYTPDFEDLIKEAPNNEMGKKWKECEELLELAKSDSPKLSAFSFNSVYMMKMKCGHYEIFQHHSNDEKELLDWVELMQSEKYYKKCTRCICEFK